MFRLSCIRSNTGKVISWMAGRGFGFIEDVADKKQHFVHFSALQVVPGGFRSLSMGQEVEFQVSMQDGRTRADNVTAIGGEPLPSGPRAPDNESNYRGGGRGRGGRGGNRGRGTDRMRDDGGYRRQRQEDGEGRTNSRHNDDDFSDF